MATRRRPVALALALALAGPLGAAEPGGERVPVLKERYVSAVEREEKARALESLSRTAPQSPGDVAALYDLFMRFPPARKAALDSLELLPARPELEPLALTALAGPEPESVFFGARLAALAGTPAALSALRELARQRLDEQGDVMAAGRGARWARLEVLDALARAQGAKALPLLRERASESHEVASIIGRRLWAPALPDILRWARSSKPAQRRLASEAAAAPAPAEHARAVRPAMLEALSDARLELAFRRELAVKAGAGSDAAEAEELARRHDAAKPGEERLLWAAALFASGQPAAIPLLARYAAEDPEEWRRRGAREQLAAMVGEDKARALLEAQKEDKK